MPDFTYNGPSPGAYPMLRDASGALVGTVEPGDVLEFDQAPDAGWEPYEPPTDTGSSGKAKRGRTAAADPDAPPPGSGDPGAAQDDDTAGESGSEEN